MKTNFRKTILVLTLASIVLLGCKKKDADPEPEPTPTPTPAAASGTLQGTVDGAVYNSDKISTMCVWNGGGYGIDGAKVENGITKSIFVMFKCEKNAALGTYAIETGAALTSGHFSGTYKANDTLIYSTLQNPIVTGLTGTLTVSAFSSSGISGTFSFSGAKLINETETKTVTSGSFTDVKVYQ